MDCSGAYPARIGDAWECLAQCCVSAERGTFGGGRDYLPVLRMLKLPLPWFTFATLRNALFDPDFC
jgi:hypothetical protein